MISDNSFTSYGQVQTTSKDSSRKAVIEFLDKHLPSFPAKFKLMSTTTIYDNEDDISQDLCNYLQDLTYPNGIFMFQFQRKPRKTRRSSDFGIIARGFSTYEAFFVIEAKRLPTCSSKREKEYVEGNLGGIERFKRNLHGIDLPQSAMIGYVQKENCSHWHTKINEWIEELITTNKVIDIIWNDEDLLKHLSDFGKVQKYSSENKRTTANGLKNWLDDKITLYHYLMQLNS